MPTRRNPSPGNTPNRMLWRAKHRGWWPVAAMMMACGGKEAPVADTVAPAPEVAAVDVAPPPKPSRLSEATEFLARAPAQRAGDDAKKALELADALTAEGTPEAKIASARLRLVVVGSVPSIGDAPLDSDAIVAQLRLALTSVEGATAPEVADIAAAARAMLAMRGVEAERLPPAERIHALIAAQSPEGNALRAAVNQHLRNNLQFGNQSFESFASKVGPLVCDACGAVPETVATAPAALKCVSEPKAAYCTTIAAAREAIGPLVDEPANLLAIAGMWLEAASRGEAGAPRLLALPVATPQALASVLGLEGVGASHAPPTVVSLAADGLRIGVRAIVAPDGKRWGPGDFHFEAAPVVSIEDLAKSEPDKETGHVPLVSDRFIALRAALDGELAKAPEVVVPWPADPVSARGSVLLALDGAAPVAAVTKVLDGLMAAGASSFAVVRGGQNDETLAMAARVAPSLAESMPASLKKSPLVLVVSKDGIEIFAPETKDGAKAIEAGVADKLPTSAQQGWRGERLVRLRVPLPPADTANPANPADPAAPTGEGAPVAQRVDTTVLQSVSDATKTIAELADAGRLVHLVATDDANTAEVLKVGRHLQELGVASWEQFNVDSLGKGEGFDLVWPNASCRGTPCVSSLVVFFSKAPVPSTRGLTDKPEKGKKVVDKPEPGPAPSAAFCNAADIKTQMARKTAAFRFCYERELQLEKDIEGRVAMNFVIGLSGAVKSVRVGSNALGNDKVGQCLSKEISKIQFAAPEGGECVVQWPFTFRKN